MNFNLEVGLLQAMELVLLGLPLVAATMVAAWLGLRSSVLLVCVALAASGASAMVMLWAFFATPEFGKTLSFLLAFGSAAAIAALARSPKARAPLKELATPFALWILASFFISYLGFLHSTNGLPLETAGHRFAGAMPNDNALPAVFATYFYEHGHHGVSPPFGDWLSSDRPPLQTGYVLAVRPFGWDEPGNHYTMLGVALQMLWVPAMWALLRATSLGARLRSLILIGVMLSDVTIIHGFFVWPKLLGAAFLIAAAAMVFSPEWKRWVRDPRAGALFAALCTLGMLSHGSSAFVLIPLLAFAFWRSVPNWRWIGAALAAVVILYIPWSAYQHYKDPPGTRLEKWQLGGHDEIDNQGVLSTIVDGYREEGVGGTIQNKWQNIKAILGISEIRVLLHNARGHEATSKLAHTVEDIRFLRYFGLFPFLGFLLLGPLAMAFRAAIDRGSGRGPEWPFVKRMGILLIISTLFWALLMFGTEIAEAVIHQGCLAVPLLGVAVCIAAAYAADRRFAIALTAFNAIFALVLEVPSLSPPPETTYSFFAGLAAGVAIICFIAIAWVQPWVGDSAEPAIYTESVGPTAPSPAG
jgi:hypothetical protein